MTFTISDAFRDGVRDRLLDVDVLAGGHGVERDGLVPVIGRADHDGVDLRDRPGSGGSRWSSPRPSAGDLGGLQQARLVDVADGDDLVAGQPLQAGHQPAGAAARADDADADPVVRALTAAPGRRATRGRRSPVLRQRRSRNARRVQTHGGPQSARMVARCPDELRRRHHLAERVHGGALLLLGLPEDVRVGLDEALGPAPPGRLSQLEILPGGGGERHLFPRDAAQRGARARGRPAARGGSCARSPESVPWRECGRGDSWPARAS